MIAVSVRNEDIVHIAEIYAQLLCVSDKHIACPSVKQDFVLLCLTTSSSSSLGNVDASITLLSLVRRFQQDRQSKLCRETTFIASII